MLLLLAVTLKVPYGERFGCYQILAHLGEMQRRSAERLQSIGDPVLDSALAN